MEDKEHGHIPVLYNEIIKVLNIKNDKKNVIVDSTVGLGGHAIGIINLLKDGDTFVSIDADIENLKYAQKRIEKFLEKENKNINTIYIHSNFISIKEKLKEHKVDSPTHIYYDFGVNSVHYDNAEKGFSFRHDGPLDLRFDRTSGITARDVVNTYREDELRRIFYDYGEEKKTHFIVDAIIKRRKAKKIETTFDLASIIKESSFDPKSKIRVFQALRMEVNNELGSIEKSLKDAFGILQKDGVIACITFHSIEDRLTKQIINELCKDEIDDLTGMIKKPAKGKKLTKKPLIPTPKELEDNPRSRSAKLRAIQKLFT